MKSNFVRMFLAVATFALAGRGISATPCDTQYRHLQTVITDAHLPEQFHRRIASRIDAGWRAYASGVDSFRASASTNLGDAGSTAASGELKGIVPDDVRTSVTAALDQLRECVNASPLATLPANVTVSVRAANGTTTRAGADVTIRVDGLVVAKTNADGTASFTVSSETHNFEAEQSPFWRGRTQSNAAATVAIVMDAGADLSTAADVEFSPVSNGVVSPNFQEATLQFLDDRGQLIRIKRIDAIELHSQNDLINVTSMFTVTTEGTLRVRTLPAFRAAIARLDTSQLSVHAFDASGTSYRGMTSPFAVGRYSVRVQLVSPVDTPAKLDSTFVRVTNERTGISYWSKTASDGAATFAHLPAGAYQYASDVVRTSDRLFARGGFHLDRDNVSVPMQLFSPHEGRQTVHEAKTAAGQAVSANAGQGRDQIAQPPIQGRWHPSDETADPHKVLEVGLGLTPEGLFKPSTAWEHDSWKIVDSLSEDELKARLQKDSVSDLDPDSRTIAVRVYDPSGQIVFRTAAVLWFVHNSSNGRNHIRPYVIITLPAEVRGRMETEAVDARLGVSLDIDAIRSEFLR